MEILQAQKREDASDSLWIRNAAPLYFWVLRFISFSILRRKRVSVGKCPANRNDVLLYVQILGGCYCVGLFYNIPLPLPLSPLPLPRLVGIPTMNTRTFWNRPGVRKNVLTLTWLKRINALLTSRNQQALSSVTLSISMECGMVKRNCHIEIKKIWN